MNPTASTRQPSLSKSRFMYGDQCHLRLWYEVFDRDLLEEPDEVTQSIFDTGHDVGELAQTRYRGGRLIVHDHEHFSDARKETLELLRDLSIPALFEPAFQYGRVRCRVDVLERLSDGGWRIIEVKSTARAKPEHELDLALQYWVLRGSKIDVRDACVLTLNPDYVRGKSLSVRSLFTLHPRWERTLELARTIRAKVDSMKRMLKEASPPEIAMGDHCEKPYPCPFYDHCSRDLPELDHPISEFYRFRRTGLQELLDLGIEEIRDVPDTLPLSDVNKEIRKSIKQKRARWRKRNELMKKLQSLRTPIRHLDFETSNPAIPQFEGTRPYQQIPFMFSVHKESRSGSLQHGDYIHEESTDPRRKIAEHLIESMGEIGSICMYSNFEATRIRDLANEYPDLRSDLLNILNRLVDFTPFIRDHYYHPDFRGSFSLKNVYPVMGESDYSDLEIDGGVLASVAYMHALISEDPDEREGIFRNLREYCKRDTLATHEILQRLRRYARL